MGNQFDKIKNLKLGIGVQIHPSVEFGNLDYCEIGDHSLIGANVRFYSR